MPSRPANQNGDAAGGGATGKRSCIAGLADGHFEDLLRSGLSTETILSSQIYSAPKAQASALVGYGVGPAMVFPYSANGDGYARIKLDHAGPDGKRYRSPAGRGNHLYIPRSIDPVLLADTKQILYITEGEKKGLRAAQDGLLCIALSGVWSWLQKDPDGQSGPIPDLDRIPWADRDTRIVFDSDLATKRGVQAAEAALAEELTRRGATVSAIRLPAGPDGAKVGLDDYLQAHGVEAFRALQPIAIHQPTEHYNQNDTGNAERFRDQHRHHARYCPEWNAWLTFDGRVWSEDMCGLRVDQMMKATILAIYDEAKHLEDEKGAGLRRFAVQCENESRRAAAVRMARSEMPVYASQLDADPWVLNCQNGLLDLKTLQLRPPRADEFCTKITRAVYDPEASDPLWEKFLEAKVPDPELRQWLQKLGGYALTGVRDQDVMGNPHGPTRSGKTTFCGALREAMGDYATDIDANIFMLSHRGHDGEANRPVLATLPGMRLVTSAEASETMRLDVAKVKRVTGCEPLTAAAKYKKPVRFKPQFLWLLHGNERVKVTGEDDAIWVRIKEIPFKESTPESEVDEAIRTRLLEDPACHAAVLRWMVEGLRRFHEDSSLKPYPKAVETETRDYRDAMNPLAPFVGEHCVLEEHAEVLSSAFKEKYTWWCDQQNIPLRVRMGDNELGKHLKRLGCESGLERGGARRRVWVGIRLRVDRRDTDDTPF